MGTHDHSHDHVDHSHEGQSHSSACGGEALQLIPVEKSKGSSDSLVRQNALQRLKIATLLCVCFFLVEVVGGVLAGSLAVLSDAAHLFSDLASFLVAIFANYLASLPSTSQHTFGLKRSESLAALFSMISLALVCVWLGWEAVRRLYVMIALPAVASDLYDVDGRLMSGIACIGVLVNVALALVLGTDGHVHMPGAHHGDHSHSHDHGSTESDHGHSHDDAKGSHDEESPLLKPNGTRGEGAEHGYTIEHVNEVRPPFVSEKPRNVNLQAAYLHVLGDLAQSVAVLIAGIIIWIRPTWLIVDPLCTLGFCILVFYSTLSVVRSSIAVLLEEVPPQISWKAIHGDLTAIPHLQGLHDLHIWCISDGVPCLSLHAFCDNCHCETTLRDIKAVCQKYGIEHITAQIQALPGPCITCEEVVNVACFE